MDMNREELVDLLTTAASIGLDMAGTAQCRGDLTEAVERRMRKQIAAALNDLIDDPSRNEAAE